MNSSPSRSDTTIDIPSFTYSDNEYCGLDHYEITGTDSDKVSVTNTNHLTYKTDIAEPKMLSFDLVVHGAGGKSKAFPTTIELNGCSSEENIITNASWNTEIVNEDPTRSDTDISIPEFTFSNSYCGL